MNPRSPLLDHRHVRLPHVLRRTAAAAAGRGRSRSSTAASSSSSTRRSSSSGAPKPGDIRFLTRGILQIGVAFHHLRKLNHHGTVYMLTRGARYLAPFAPALPARQRRQLLQTRPRRRFGRWSGWGPTRLAGFRLSARAQGAGRMALDFQGVTPCEPVRRARRRICGHAP